MKFICGECKTKYTISDEKVRGKVLKVKCKKCEAIVEVREAAAGIEAVAPVVAGGEVHDATIHPAAASPGYRPPTSVARSRVPTAPPGGPPRARLPTPPPGAPRGRSITSPPPPPAEALAQRTATPRPKTAVPLAGAGGIAAPMPVGRPASPRGPVPRNGGSAPARSKSAVLGRPAGLAGSLAEALRDSVVPDSDPDAPQKTVVSPHGMLESLGLSSRPSLLEWYVAIRDQPVGPISKDDVQAKISAGDVSGSSLIWREGMDDWRPLREVHALGDILRGTGRLSVPEAPPGRTPLRSSSVLTPLPISPDRTVGSVATPIIKGAVAMQSSLFPETSSPSSGSASAGSDSLEFPISEVPPSSHALALATAPTGPRMGLVDAYPSIAPPAPARKLSPLAWVAIIGAMAFGITLALGLLTYLGPRLNAPRTGPERVRVVTIPGDAPPPELPVTAAPGQIAAPVPGAPLAPGSDRRIPHAGAGGGPPSKVPGKALSAADAELLARMGQQGLPADRLINTGALHKNTSGSEGGSSLTADQVRSVVRRESRTVQQCYERAMRGAQQARDVRVTVTANVGPSGTVTGVRARGGSSDPGMLACIEGAVRRWHFPASSGSSMPEIPFVFTAADR